MQSNNTSGYKGVSLHKQSGLWFAYAQAEGKRYSAGYHKTPEEGRLQELSATRLLN
ncbi:hypothetical protein CJT86_34860 [Pseudomonas aeruginosa]|nr:hypothetical protein CJT86_34860 [Pseudomonas aeruginosa]